MTVGIEDEPRERRPLPDLITRAGITAWSLVGIIVFLGALVWIARWFRVLLAPVVLAVALIFVLNPLVRRFVALHLPRIVAAFVAFAVLAGIVVLLGFLVAPSISDQAKSLGTDFPTIYEDSTAQIEDLIERFGFGEVDLWSYEQLQDFVQDPDRQDQILSAVWGKIGAVTSGIFEAILVFFVAPVVAFYVLIDLPRVREEAMGLVPQRHRAEVLYVSRRLGESVGGFLRGQVLVAIIVGVLTSAGFWLIDLKFWLIIGMTAGFLNIIPFVGPWAGGAMGVLVGLVTADVTTAFWAAMVALVVQQIDNNFVSPTVLRATVRLHPAVVILVLILGGATGGLWGVLLAVPLTASLKILGGHLWRTRVLGSSWEEAIESIIEESEPPEPLLSQIRRAGAAHEHSTVEVGGSAPEPGEGPAGEDGG